MKKVLLLALLLALVSVSTAYAYMPTGFNNLKLQADRVAEVPYIAVFNSDGTLYGWIGVIVEAGTTKLAYLTKEALTAGEDYNTRTGEILTDVSEGLFVPVH
jgi:hypothetical protein